MLIRVRSTETNVELGVISVLFSQIALEGCSEMYLLMICGIRVTCAQQLHVVTSIIPSGKGALMACRPHSTSLNVNGPKCW